MGIFVFVRTYKYAKDTSIAKREILNYYFYVNKKL